MSQGPDVVLAMMDETIDGPCCTGPSKAQFSIDFVLFDLQRRHLPSVNLICGSRPTDLGGVSLFRCSPLPLRPRSSPVRPPCFTDL